MNLKHKAFSLFVTLILCIASLSARSYSVPVENLFHPEGLQGEIDDVRQDIEDTYYDMVKKGHFDISYVNNFVIDLKLQGGVQKEAMIILALIEWLDNQKDQTSRLLLAKLNSLYFLEFTRFIVSLDSSKTRSTELLEDFQTLYHYAINDRDLGHVEPFRIALSKLILLVHMVNESELRYEHRKETLALALDKIKTEMLHINDEFGTSKLDGVIKSFVTLLEVYAVREPLVKPRTMEKIIWGTVVVIVAVIIIHRVALNWDKINKLVSDSVVYFKENISRPIMRTIVEEFVTVLTERGLFREAGEQLADGLAWRYVPAPAGQEGPSFRIPNPDFFVIADTLMHGARQGAETPTVRDAAHNVVRGGVAGVGSAVFVDAPCAVGRGVKGLYEAVKSRLPGGGT